MVRRMPERPSDCGIYIKKLEETLFSCFEQWKEVVAVLNRYPGKSESVQARDFDLIDCFCCDIKDRLTESRRRGSHPGLWRFGQSGEPPS
ncbi:MAG: hypothetical protein ACYSWO_04275 [Planctomycetota bacterium]|jgi:hypothetical protein